MTKYLDTLKHPEKFKQLTCKLSGVSFPSSSGENRQDLIKKLKETDDIFLETDEENEYDSHAVRCWAIINDYEMCDIGFIPKSLNTMVFMLLKTGSALSARIVEITTPRTDKDLYGVKIKVDLSERNEK